jgi:hypothetical protein
MWAQKSVLRVDVFTYTIRGAPWLNQQWGAQLFLSSWFAALGWKGLTVLQGLVAGGCYGGVYLVARRRGATEALAAGATLVAFGVAGSVPGALALRPQLLALPLFVLALWIVLERREAPRRLWALPLIGVIWANMHGSFVLLTVLLLIALGDDLARRSPAWRRTALFAALSLVTPLVTPWGLSTYTYVWHVSTDPMVRQVITEWRPMLDQTPANVAFALVTIGAAAALWRRRSRRLTLEEALLLVVFTLLAALSARNVLWWSAVLPVVLSGPLAGWRVGGAWSAGATRVVAASLAALIAVGAVRLTEIDDAALRSEAPPGITTWLAGRPSDERIFAEWWGGWFEFALPDRPMFVDARVEIFPDAIWQDYLTVVDAEPSWNELLDRWHVDTIVLARDHHPEFAAALASDPGWALAYDGPDGWVYVRNDQAVATAG